MEYRDIRYNIRFRVTPGEWAVTIYPPDQPPVDKVIYGPRTLAEKAVFVMIDGWLKKQTARP